MTESVIDELELDDGRLISNFHLGTSKNDEPEAVESVRFPRYCCLRDDALTEHCGDDAVAELAAAAGTGDDDDDEADAVDVLA